MRRRVTISRGSSFQKKYERIKKKIVETRRGSKRKWIDTMIKIWNGEEKTWLYGENLVRWRDELLRMLMREIQDSLDDSLSYLSVMKFKAILYKLHPTAPVLQSPSSSQKIIQLY